MLALALATTINFGQFRRGKGSWLWAINPGYIDPPPGHSISEGGGASFYASPAHFDLLTWNCRLAYAVVGDSRDGLNQVCREGIAASYIMIPLLIFQGAMLSSHFWVWRAERKAIPWYQERLRSEEEIARSAKGSE